MGLWNFAHDVLNTHVYELLMGGVVVIMAIYGLIHGKKQKNRQETYDYALKKKQEK